MLANVKLYVQTYEWENNNHNHKIILCLEDDDTIEGQGDSRLSAVYNLYKEVYYTENLMKIPSLSDMSKAIDVNTDWNNEPTLVFKDCPYELIEKYKLFFTYTPSSNRIGTIKLVEDTFHVVTESIHQPVGRQKTLLRSRKGKATHVGGLITRLK